MDFESTLTGALNSYGLVAIFASVFAASIGVPLPTSFLLLFAGSLVANGDLEYWPVILIGILAAVLGDHTSFAMGWFGGQSFMERLTRRFKAGHLVEKVEGLSQKWGGLSIFLSRWLLTEFAVPVNLVSGTTRYSPLKFAAFVIAGEVLWVLAYVQLGQFFSGSIAEVSDALGDFAGVILALLAVLVLGYLLWQNLRGPKTVPAAQLQPVPVPELAEPSA
jgi:membrane protein DedA with SNARE-associated domain